MPERRLPSFQFYPGDWMKDPAVRSVSLAARGLWTDMLCLMHENDRRGYLQLTSGKPVTAQQLARMTGCSTDEVSRLLQELEDSGVYSRTEHGVIYSRRMIRDERKRQLCSEAGKTGGNPTLKGVSKGVSRVGVKPNPTPSSSSSSSSSDEKKIPGGAAGPPDPPGVNGNGHRRPGTGPFAELADYFVGRWKAKYGRPYPFRKLDGIKSAELLKACGGILEDAKAAIDRYLADDGEFYRGHPLMLLASGSQLPRFLTPRTNGHAIKRRAGPDERVQLTLAEAIAKNEEESRLVQ